jgi:hypothetical protein
MSGRVFTTQPLKYIVGAHNAVGSAPQPVARDLLPVIDADTFAAVGNMEAAAKGAE